jgi:hypothetical protein
MDDRTQSEKAIDEIKEVLAKYDCGGFACVVSKDDIAFVRKIDPTWSCAWLQGPVGEDGAAILRIRSRLKEDYDGDKDRQKAEIEATTGMFFVVHRWCEETAENMKQVIKLLAEKFPDIRHHEQWRRGRW